MLNLASTSGQIQSLNRRTMSIRMMIRNGSEQDWDTGDDEDGDRGHVLGEGDSTETGTEEVDEETGPIEVDHEDA